MNKKLLLMAGVLSIIGSSAMADNITQDGSSITVWRTSDGNVVGNTVIDSNSISVNDNSMTATTGNKNRTLITTDSVVVHSGTFNRDRIEGGLYNNGGVAFSKFQYNPGEDVPSKRSFATLTLEYGLELNKAEPGSNPGMDNRRTSLLNTEELRIRKIEDNSVYSQIEVASNGLKIMDGNPKQPTSRKNLEFSSEKVDVGGQTINNVAEGIDGTDAVNVNQLERYVDSKIKPVKSGDNITVNPNYDFFRNVDSFSVDLNKDLTDMNSVKFKNEEFDTESEINHASASFYNKKQNEGSALTSHSLELNTNGSNSSLSGTGLTVTNGFDNNTSTIGANGFATETKDGRHLEFSSDIVTIGGQQIHDIAKGIDDTDAVNVKQLKDYVAANDKDTITTVKAGNNIEVTANGHDYTISLKKDVVDKIDNLVNQIGNNDTKINNMINNTRQEARRGIASASALAALHPLDYNPDHKVDVMGGVGHYRGNTAVALGAAYRPNENLMFTVGTAINGKDSSVNAGVSYKVGANDSTYKSQASLAKDVEDLKQIVAKLQAELEEARKK